MAEKEQALEVEGVVTQALANTRFRVQIQGGHIVNAHVAGKMRKTSSGSFRVTRFGSNSRPTT